VQGSNSLLSGDDFSAAARVGQEWQPSGSGGNSSAAAIQERSQATATDSFKLLSAAMQERSQTIFRVQKYYAGALFGRFCFRVRKYGSAFRRFFAFRNAGALSDDFVFANAQKKHDKNK